MFSIARSTGSSATPARDTRASAGRYALMAVAQCARVADRPMNAEPARQPKPANEAIDRLLPQQR